MKMIPKFMMLLAFLPLLFVGCNNDDEDETVKVSKDGAYITGTATGSVDVKFADALVEGSSFSSYHRPGMYEVYFYLVAGNLEFKVIKNDVGTVYGAKTIVNKVLDGTDKDQITGSYTTGELAVGENSFAIATEGFYHILYDETSKNYWVIPVNKWEWVYDDIELTQTTGASATKVEWTKTNVKMAKNSSKFRYDDGWKIVTELPILPEEDPLTDGTVVIIFTNLGFNDQNALEPGAGNGDIEKGMYDIKLTWTPAQGFVSKFTKTADVENTDYSAYLMGMIGNGVLVADTSWGWGSLSYMNSLPTKSGEIYTWNYAGVTIGDTVGGRSWKFREGNKWDFNFGYTGVSMAGSAATDFFSGSSDGNFGVATTATYDFVLTVNADNDEWTLTAVSAGGPTYDIWGLIGNATPGGWETDTEMTPNNDGTVWTWTGALVAGEYKFRANGLWDEQIGDNGAGGATFSNNATAWVIAAGAEGNYTIVLNSVTPSVTVTKN